MTVTLPNSYNTNAIYGSVPQFIQDQDAANGYQLWYFLYGACAALDQLDILSRNNVGQGIHIEADVGGYSAINISDGQIATPIAASDTTINIFSTDSTWYNFPTTSAFEIQLVNSLTGTTEKILIPAGHYDWSAPIVAISGVNRNLVSLIPPVPVSVAGTTITVGSTAGLSAGMYVVNATYGINTTISSITNSTQFVVVSATGITTSTPLYIGSSIGLAWPASTGADGSVYVQDWAGAPGWSQAVDIERCPNYALPWLAQFIGAAIPPNAVMDRQQMVQQIESLGGFNRATAPAITQQLIQVINSQLASGVAPLSQSQVIIMENVQMTTYTVTAAVGASGTVTYTCSNALTVGQVVTISGLTVSALNLTNVVVATVSPTQFTVTNAATGTATSQTGYATPKVPYTYNFSALTILLPSIYFSPYSYQTLLTDAGGVSTTYTGLQSYLASIGGLYFDLQGNTVASNNSPYINFIYRYRPAGMQVFVGGY